LIARNDRTAATKPTSGVDPADLELMVGIMRTYIDDGIVCRAIARVRGGTL
jgi:hypothetical protein